MITWGAAQTSALVFLWHDGLRTREIGSLLGVSMGSVLGRARRIGLAPHPLSNKAKNVGLPTTAKLTGSNTGGGTMHAIIASSGRPVGPQATELANGHSECGVSLMDIKGYQCRWIVSGEREHAMFCGKIIHGHSYCLTHYEIAYSRHSKDSYKKFPIRRRYR